MKKFLTVVCVMCLVMALYAIAFYETPQPQPGMTSDEFLAMAHADDQKGSPDGLAVGRENLPDSSSKYGDSLPYSKTGEYFHMKPREKQETEQFPAQQSDPRVQQILDLQAQRTRLLEEMWMLAYGYIPSPLTDDGMAVMFGGLFPKGNAWEHIDYDMDAYRDLVEEYDDATWSLRSVARGMVHGEWVEVDRNPSSPFPDQFLSINNDNVIGQAQIGRDYYRHYGPVGLPVGYDDVSDDWFTMSDGIWFCLRDSTIRYNVNGIDVVLKKAV